MTRDEVFEEIYGYMNTLLEENSELYDNAIVLPYLPSQDFNDLPVIVLSQLDYRLSGETLAKTEKKHEFTIEAQIFTIDTQTDHRRTVGNRIADMVEDVIQNDYGLRLESSSVIPNLNENIYRIFLRFVGVIDDDTLIIYRTV